MTMMIQNHETSFVPKPGDQASGRKAYYAAVPAHMLEGEGNLIDELIKFTFDVLGAPRLDMRVYDDAAARLWVAGERLRTRR
jgi:hypothetical protein